MKKIFEGVYKENGNIYTINLVKDHKVYGEKIVEKNGIQYRCWDFWRSKLAAAIKKGLKNFPFNESSKVLYLGASTGTTVSHLSDICKKGIIYAVEISEKMMEKLIILAEKRQNIVPILADARKPDFYKEVGKVDIIYQDLAQRDQDMILIKNVKMFFPEHVFLCLKSHSIDVKKDKKETLEEALKSINTNLIDFETLEVIDLNPYDKEHYFIYIRKIE